MSQKFPISKLTFALLSMSAASVSFAAGLDRSGQDISAFLQDGTYAEIQYTYIDADVTGHDNATGPSDTYTQGTAVSDIAESYSTVHYGVKTDINDTFSVGVIFDEPWGAAAEYSGDNNFVTKDAESTIAGMLAPKYGITSLAQSKAAAAQAQAAAAKSAAAGDMVNAAKYADQAKKLGLANATAQAAAHYEGEGTNVEVRTKNLSTILGMKLGANKQFQVYGGPVMQTVDANIKLRGITYSGANGYTAEIEHDLDYGWLAGVSYSKPEIGLKAALTYRSEIDHSARAAETYPLAAAVPSLNAFAQGTTDIDITTPESFNLNFQTGLNPTTLATAKVRYVPWSDFSIVPKNYNEISKLATNDDKGLPIVDYSDDQWQVELGLAKRLNPSLAVSGSIGWDSGAGNPVTSLGPIEGYYSVGLGAKYNVTPNWAISAGGKYLKFGDAKAIIPDDRLVANFEDNDGFVVGVKLSYQEK